MSCCRAHGKRQPAWHCLGEISVEREGDIDVSAVWVLGDTPEAEVAGFTAVRVKAHLVRNASREERADIVEWADKWSLVANMLRNTVAVTATLALESINSHEAASTAQMNGHLVFAGSGQVSETLHQGRSVAFHG